jgi:hypothetical protein
MVFFWVDEIKHTILSWLVELKLAFNIDNLQLPSVGIINV